MIKHELKPHSQGVARVVYPEALAGFQVTYVQVSALAKQLNTTSRSLLRKFDEREIETVGGFQDGKATSGLLVALSDLARGLDKPLITSFAGKSK
ncbi:hypothetical protein [uncultured Aliiroseovarius sp.]|uniref:hypothetical protein n=1 Tax=uncultured Aliiroseovarius sp. TaxID=1658783 RepID=UPI0026357616|nr:hypothetical protein [uncultured Aliiroseovarius sp.]